jgi:hypothetical protein
LHWNGVTTFDSCRSYRICPQGFFVRTAAFVLAIIVAAFPLEALAYCSEPSAPSCASRYGSFDDEWEFDRCKSEMESYQSDVEQFISCNNDEAQRAVEEAKRASERAASEYSDAVDHFNRRARQ